MLWLSVAHKDVHIIYCLLFTYSALSVTSLPPRGATVHALNRKSVKIEEFPVVLSVPGFLVMLITSHLSGWNSIVHVFPRQPIYLCLSEMPCCLVHFSLLNRSWRLLQTSALLTSNYQLCYVIYVKQIETRAQYRALGYTRDNWDTASSGTFN